ALAPASPSATTATSAPMATGRASRAGPALLDPAIEVEANVLFIRPPQGRPGDVGFPRVGDYDLEDMAVRPELEPERGRRLGVEDVVGQRVLRQAGDRLAHDGHVLPELERGADAERDDAIAQRARIQPARL